MGNALSIIAGVAMAIGAPAIYFDQAYSMVRKKNAAGFSRDICAILLIANITRCFFWIGDRFEIALLVQSLLMILAQLGLLYICIRFRPLTSPEALGESARPLKFWQWKSYWTYLEFLAGYIVLLTFAVLILGRFAWFVATLGYFALGLESTLPLPQMYSNWVNKTLYGFRITTLGGWLIGDTFKVTYFFIKNAPIQFKIFAIFSLSVDLSTSLPSLARES
ncbi:hypothetical protein CALVIDRAFT_532188 [Calocera viscosa TUFC12733]|uniref:PQ-loop-domain-containing protein n=1 Tax=Calocera viscosa (strain TUFC12733) TaxID=1330018 RepID=A0A167RYX7_CALVF|nr:hypothetical protein CALVIDRAFT_532188 [Calocera viscosa TUFC12733]